MASKVFVHTVPHTGTRFVGKFFLTLGYKKVEFSELRDSSEQINMYCAKHFPFNDIRIRPQDNHDAVPSNVYMVTPLRDPYLVAISNMHGHMFSKSYGMGMERLHSMYNVLISRSTRMNIVYFDLECPVEKRESHLVSVLKQLDAYDDTQLPIIKLYAEQWKPVGATNTEWKRTYLETGELPNEIRRCDLERVVNWHKKAKEKCVYDYIT
jgi:hypothetical protein